MSEKCMMDNLFTAQEILIKLRKILNLADDYYCPENLGSIEVLFDGTINFTGREWKYFIELTEGKND